MERVKKLTKKQIIEALKEVIDPEIGISLVEMDLIRDILIEGDRVKIKMTLTTPGCPLASYLADQVKKKVESLKGIKKVEVEIVF